MKLQSDDCAVQCTRLAATLLFVATTRAVERCDTSSSDTSTASTLSRYYSTHVHHSSVNQSLYNPQQQTANAKGVDLTGLLGGRKRRLGSGDPSGVQGRSPGRGSGDEVPQKLKLFCETTHNICVKIQQTTVAVTRVDILNDITS